MPNEVYLRTRDALATLVSERAATRVLDVALRRSHATADGLEPQAVRTLLLGPVQRELENILPRNGLRRTLKRLARQIAEASDTPGPSRTDVTPRRPHPQAEAELHPVTRSSVYLPGLPLPPANGSGPSTRGSAAAVPPSPASAPHESVPRREAAQAAAGTSGGGSGGATAVAASDRRPTVVPHPLGAEALDALAVHFAAIEGVRQVVALRAASAPQVRGEGLDADALAPVAQSAVRLLGRYGPLRSLVLEHHGGLLFVFPLGRDAIAVLARTDVNMGAVFAARAALEEGP